MFKRAVYAVSDELQTVRGLVLTWGALAALAFALRLSREDWLNDLNLAISLITMAIGSLILVSGRRGSEAEQAKLDALILAVEEADNRLVGLDRRTDDEIMAMRPV